MEWLQSLLDSSTTPAFTAFLLGLLTALSPCPLATNIAAVGYIGRRVGCNKSVFVNGLLYTAGRIVAYTLLGFILILLLQGGSSLFGVQKYIAKYGEMLIARGTIAYRCIYALGQPVAFALLGGRWQWR